MLHRNLFNFDFHGWGEARLNRKIKKCKDCNIIKGVNEFYFRKSCIDGYDSKCKKCHNMRGRKNYENNKEKISLQHKKYWRTKRGKEIAIKSKKKHKELNPNYMNEYRKKYNVKNREKLREYHKLHERKRRSTPKGKINNSMSTGIYSSLINGKHGRHWEGLVDYTLQELIDHLENQFEDWMNWDNYGRPKNRERTWSIDHILPISSFNFNGYEDEEFEKCWSLSNLRPLCFIENIKKFNKIA